MHLPWRLVALLKAATRMRSFATRCMMLPRQAVGLQQVRAGSLLHGRQVPCLLSVAVAGITEPPRWM